jgi:hypothetical protein
VGTPSVTVFAESDRPRWAVRGSDHRGIGGAGGGWPDVAPVVDAIDELLARRSA